MTLHLKWVWELTPNQVFQKNRFVRRPASSERLLQQEVRAFATQRIALPEPGLSYQLALTSMGQTEESVALRERHPAVPDSGSSKSGVLLFKDDAIIGSLILSGVNQKNLFKMVIEPEHRGKRLAEKLLVLWWSNVSHTYRTDGRQAMNWMAVQALLNAYKTVSEKALADGLPVPSAVQHELTTHAEATAVLLRAKAADSVPVRRRRRVDQV